MCRTKEFTAPLIVAFWIVLIYSFSVSLGFGYQLLIQLWAKIVQIETPALICFTPDLWESNYEINFTLFFCPLFGFILTIGFAILVTIIGVITLHLYQFLLNKLGRFSLYILQGNSDQV